MTLAQARRALAVARRRRDAAERLQRVELPALCRAAREAGMQMIEIGAALKISRVQTWRLMQGKKKETITKSRARRPTP
jgi:hypothetical protein